VFSACFNPFRYEKKKNERERERERKDKRKKKKSGFVEEPFVRNNMLKLTNHLVIIFLAFFHSWLLAIPTDSFEILVDHFHGQV